MVTEREKSPWAVKRAAMEKGRSMNDFQRFNAMLMKKAREGRCPENFGMGTSFLVMFCQFTEQNLSF
jgi:hypothetical protein